MWLTILLRSVSPSPPPRGDMEVSFNTQIFKQSSFMTTFMSIPSRMSIHIVNYNPNIAPEPIHIPIPRYPFLYPPFPSNKFHTKE